MSAVFDDPNLVSSAGLVPILALARSAGLAELAQKHLSVPTDKGASAGLKVVSLAAGMVAGADNIDDMALLRHGGMGRVFTNAYAPSTLGSFLRAFTFAHVRQLDSVASRFLARLAARVALIAQTEGNGERVLVDIDDTIIEVHGYAKQGPGYGYSGVRGLNAVLATVSTSASRAGGRGPAAAERIVWFTARRETAGHRRAEDRHSAHLRRCPTAAGPCASAWRADQSSLQHWSLTGSAASRPPPRSSSPSAGSRGRSSPECPSNTSTRPSTTCESGRPA